MPSPCWPPGFQALRLLAEGRGGGSVSLARKTSGELVALKILRLREGTNYAEALQRHQVLMALTESPGLLRIQDCGLTGDSSFLWEALDVADNLDGQPLSEEPDYTPFTLRAGLIENGPLGLKEVVSVGLGICKGLATLHAAGLVHRDVKPANLFRVRGAAVLGDYGLVGPPGVPFDFVGTEGFVPTEGNIDARTDLFALGKTLYELWTGCDRLEFPTLPDRIVREPDWSGAGSAFNDFLLGACSPRSAERYISTEAFAGDLQEVVKGRSPRLNRRRWIRIGAISAAAATCVAAVPFLLKKRPVVRWRLARKWSYVPPNWGRRPSILDEKRGMLFQFLCGINETVLHKIDLASFSVTRMEFHTPFNDLSEGILHPVERTIWFAEGGRGPVWRLDPDTGTVTQVGSCTPKVDTCFSAVPYWNALNQRMGMFGGYGHFAMHNWRWEFDGDSARWVEVEENDPKRQPCCRCPMLLAPTEGGRKLLLFGGAGNSSGFERQRDPGFRVWTSRWHMLGDVWTVDLTTGSWECLVPLPGLQLPNEYSAAFLPNTQILVVSHVLATSEKWGTPPELFVHHLRKGTPFTKAVCRGDVPDGHGELFLAPLNKDRKLLAVHATGLYELTVED